MPALQVVPGRAARDYQTAPAAAVLPPAQSLLRPVHQVLAAPELTMPAAGKGVLSHASVCCRPPVERLHGSLQRLPLLGTLSNKAIEILFGIQEYYTYTSAS